MSNSNLVSYIDSGSRNYNQRTGPISKITVHHAAGKLTLEQFSNIMHSGREVSWNYAISYDGKIGLFIEEKYRAWTTSSRENDGIAITIEVSNSSNGEPWPISQASYKALLNLCEDICRRNNIKAIAYTGNKSGNLTMHKWFASTGCPGPTLSTKFPDIMKTVNTRLGQPSTLEYLTNPEVVSGTAADYAMTGTMVPIESLLDYTQLNPYMATFSRKSPNTDMSKLKDIGVVGVMIEAGVLFDEIHIKQKYRNPKLNTQVQAAVDANLPFALYHTIRAKSIKEADQELSELQTCIQKYNPILGVWLRPAFHNSTKTNNDIIDRYRDHLIRLGVKFKMGLYATREELKQIDWQDRCNDWYLWLVSHVDDIADTERILDPEFFMLDEEKAATSGSNPYVMIQSPMYSPLDTTLTTAYSTYLFCGDSRTVGMMSAIHNSASSIAEVGATVKHLKNNLSKIMNYNQRNIVLWYGVNDRHNVSTYVKIYNELYSSMGSVSNIVVVNVGPCDKAYSPGNTDISNFNKNLKRGLSSGILYIDLYSYLTSEGFTTADGLHYTSSTYQEIYKYIDRCVKGST